MLHGRDKALPANTFAYTWSLKNKEAFKGILVGETPLEFRIYGEVLG